MCVQLIIDGQEYGCCCGDTWWDTMARIGEHTDRLLIGEKLVIEQTEFDLVVTRTKKGE